MKSSTNLTLKNSYKHLQTKMWQISTQAYQLNKQNEILKSRVSTQRIVFKKRNTQVVLGKNTENINEKNNNNENQTHARNFDRQLKHNLKLKEKITWLQQEKKQVEKNLTQTDIITRKNKKILQALKKYTRKLEKMQKLECKSIEKYTTQLQLGQKQVEISEAAELIQEEQEQLLKKINTYLEILDQEKKYNKLLSSQILGLIDKKNTLKKTLKNKNQSEGVRGNS